MKNIYNKELLDSIININNAHIKHHDDKLNSKTRITFLCSCGTENTKSFLMLINGGGVLCKSCCSINARKKLIKTNLEKYGVENAQQNKEVKEKSKKTNLEKYGVENPFSSPDIIKKIKNTNLEKYGVEYATQNKQIIEKTINTNLEKYGVKSPLQNNIINTKMKKTNLEKYGVENVSQNSEIHNKKIETSIKHYNVNYPFQTEIIRKKINETCFKRYGFNSPLQSEIIKEKIKNTNLLRRGVEYPMQSLNVKEKLKENNMKKYGVEYAFQSEEVQIKISENSYKYKKYKMPSGEIRNVQGYEPYALDELVKLYKEEDIKTNRKDIPRIKYMINNLEKYYFPDIFIPIENKIIEIKSTWTYKKKMDIILKKAKATKAKQYIYEIWIYNAKKEKQIIIF